MKDNVARFIEANNLAADPCAASFSLGKACMMLPKHEMFVGSEIDEVCFKGLLISLL